MPLVTSHYPPSLFSIHHTMIGGCLIVEVEVVIVVEGEVVAVVDVHHTTHYSTRIGRCLLKSISDATGAAAAANWANFLTA